MHYVLGNRLGHLSLLINSLRWLTDWLDLTLIVLTGQLNLKTKQTKDFMFLFQTLHEYKFEFLRIVCSHEHYIPLSLPLMRKGLIKTYKGEACLTRTVLTFCLTRRNSIINTYRLNRMFEMFSYYFIMTIDIGLDGMDYHASINVPRYEKSCLCHI